MPKKDVPKKDVLESVLNIIGLDSSNAPEDEDYDDEDDGRDLGPEPDMNEPEKPARRSRVRLGNGTSSKRNVNRGERQDEMYNIHRMHARTIEDGKQITELLKNRTTVIINLEGVDLAVAQRIIDYTSGSCFALDAKLESISSFIFMASPSSANVTADGGNENVSSIDVPGSDYSDLL